MISNITIKNFKSSRNLSLDLKPLTILTGLNGSGKSSVFQAISIIKQSDVRNTHRLFLNGNLVRLGNTEDVLNENSKDDFFSVEISRGTLSRCCVADCSLKADIVDLSGTSSLVYELFSDISQFTYLAADRITPNASFPIANKDEIETAEFGIGGELSIDYLIRHADEKVSKNRQFRSPFDSVPNALLKRVSPTEKLNDQVAGWLQEISPGALPRVTEVDIADVNALRFEYVGTELLSRSRSHRPANVGFGLTYTLPILIALLSLKKGSLLLLENPEAHLHPKGQFAMGYLLSLCANDGVQVMVETHSDHVINGIRVAAKENEIEAEKAVIHFFERDIESGETSSQEIRVDGEGRLSDWPEGFFDVWDSALDKLV